MTPFLRSSDGGSQEKVRVLGSCTVTSKLRGGPSGAVYITHHNGIIPLHDHNISCIPNSSICMLSLHDTISPD